MKRNSTDLGLLVDWWSTSANPVAITSWVIAKANPHANHFVIPDVDFDGVHKPRSCCNAPFWGVAAAPLVLYALSVHTFDITY